MILRKSSSFFLYIFATFFTLKRDKKSPFYHNVIKNITNDIALSRSEKKYICIFSHYDKEGKIAEYVIYYLKKLVIFSDIVFVTTAENINQNELDKLDNLCIQIIIKRNVGYDFGAWKTGMELSNLKVHLYDNLILANDSVFGPFYDLAPILETAKVYDVFSMTDSHEHKYHLQSYFMIYSRKALNHELFKSFWDSLVIYENKYKLIREFEINYSARLIESNLRVSSFCSVNKKEVNKNPLHYNWVELVGKKKLPFIKIELLRDNPNNVDIGNWHNIIKKTGYDLSLINKYLNNTGQHE